MASGELTCWVWVDVVGIVGLCLCFGGRAGGWVGGEDGVVDVDGSGGCDCVTCGDMACVSRGVFTRWVCAGAVGTFRLFVYFVGRVGG